MVSLFDYAFVMFGKAFPLDLIMLMIFIGFYFAASLHSIVSQGIQFFEYNLYKIRKGATYPQALVFASFFMIIIMYSFIFDLQTLMP